MRVVDHEPSLWFLFEEDGELYVDGHYGHSFVGYTYPIQLSGAETREYRRDGREAIHRLVERVQYTAPILKASTSEYKGRKVDAAVAERMHEAVRAWKQNA